MIPNWVVIATDGSGQAFVLYPGEYEEGQTEEIKKNLVISSATAQGLINPTAVPLASLSLDHNYSDAWVRAGDEIFVDAPKALVCAKKRRKATVDKLRATKLDEGATYSGVVVPMDKDTQSTLTGLLVQAIALGANFPGYVYHSPTGESIALANGTAVIEMTQALAAAAATIDAVSWGHKDAIEALGSAEAVEGYDISSGW